MEVGQVNIFSEDIDEEYVRIFEEDVADEEEEEVLGNGNENSRSRFIRLNLVKKAEWYVRHESVEEEGGLEVEKDEKDTALLRASVCTTYQFRF